MKNNIPGDSSGSGEGCASAGGRAFLRVRAHILLALLIVFVSVAARLHGLGQRSLWFDESIIVLEVYNPVPENTDTGSGDIHPPLFRILWRYLTQISAPPAAEVSSLQKTEEDTPLVFNERALRLPSVLFSLLAVVLIYAIGKSLFGTDIALSSAALMGISAFQVYYAQEIKMYALFECLSLASGLLFITALKNGRKLFWAGHSLVNALALYTHYSAFLLLGGQAVFVLFYSICRSGRRTVKYWVASSLFTALLFLPWSGKMLHHILRVKGHFWVPPPTPGQLAGIFKNFFFGYHTAFSGSTAGTLATLAVCLAPTLYLARCAVRRDGAYSWGRSDSAVFIFVSIFVPFLAALALSPLFCPLLFDRPLIFASGYFYLLFACGLRLLFRRSPAAAVCLSAVFLAVSMSALRGYYRNENFEPSAGVVMNKPLREVCDYIKRAYKPGETVLLSHYGMLYPMACYLPRRMLPGIFLIDSPVEDKYEKNTLYGMLRMPWVKTAAERQLHGKEGGLWLVCGGWNREIIRPPAGMAEFLSRQRLVKENRAFEGVEIYYYELRR
ncbi:MAG: glycosyltransferase family 39 protein [Candidatus Omnitrophica bacterium]|nr:glycosyltransferase family 39 protein [Candidatus Omnitrophota bacterium]